MINKTTTIKMLGGRVKAAAFDGQVKVWNSVAGYWTSHHSATPAQIRRVKALASN